MTQQPTNFNLSLEPEYDDYDPLEDVEPEGDAEDESSAWPVTPAVSERPVEDRITEGSPAEERPAKERVADLLKSMAPRRTVLLGILSFCVEPQPVAQVNALVDELQKDNFSVYTAANLCSLLEKAGALDRITADGAPAEDVDAEPRVVVVDGVEYLEASEPTEVFWATTEAGAAAVDADRPLDRLRKLLDKDSAYQPIYQRVLALCATEGGATTNSLGEAVDNDPLVQKPRFYVAHFIDQLEKCDALIWKSSWMTTEVGQAGLEMLSDVIGDIQLAPDTAAFGKE